LIVLWPGRDGNRDGVRGCIAFCLCKIGECGAERGDEVRESLSLSRGGRKLKIDVDPVKAIVLNELDCGGNKSGTLCRISDYCEVLAVVRICPTANGEGDLEISIRLIALVVEQCSGRG
jgi:hypothetical protein